jgi:hypothetical protein
MAIEKRANVDRPSSPIPALIDPSTHGADLLLSILSASETHASDQFFNCLVAEVEYFHR